MINRPDHPTNNHKELKFPLNIFLIIISISLVVIGIVAYSFHLGYKMSAKFSPLVHAAMEIKLETTTAHLWFEEIVSGDRNEKIEDVIKHIDNAIWYATAMLEGGENPEGSFVPLANPIMRKDIKEVLVKIKSFKEITKERYATIKESGVGTQIDQRYDGIFRSFQEQADFVETKLQDAIASDLNRYRYLLLFLLVSLISSTFFLLFIFYRYEKQRAKNIALIRKAFDEVKVLSGLLPICASCKNIRDDEGYWNQIESYIHKHSEARFSHSICPECSKELYPDLV
jgi:hypothetical protein